MEFVLPTEPSAPATVNPRFLILFGKPKSGKTEAVSRIENNLLVDIEDGSDFVSGLKIKANSIDDLLKIKKAVEEAGKPYEYITLDSGTALEELCLPLAAKLYRQTPMGKKWTGDDVRTLPNGAGYMYTRLAFNKILGAYRGLTKNFILLAHTKERMIDRDGKEMSEHMLDLTGKTERIVSSQADAIGYVYRRKNETRISFVGGSDFIVEARSPHLRGQDVLIMDSDDKGVLTSYWENIYK